MRSEEETLPPSCLHISARRLTCVRNVSYTGARNIIPSMLRESSAVIHRHLGTLEKFQHYDRCSLEIRFSRPFFSRGTNGVHTSRAFYRRNPRPSKETRNSITNRIRRTTIIHPPPRGGIYADGVNIESATRDVSNDLSSRKVFDSRDVLKSRPTHVAVTQIAQS